MLGMKLMDKLSLCWIKAVVRNKNRRRSKSRTKK